MASKFLDESRMEPGLEEDDGPEDDEEPQAAESTVAIKSKPERPSLQHELPQSEADPLRVIEAALFLGNRPFTFAELALLSKTSVRKGRSLVLQLQKEYSSNGGAIEISVDSQQAVMQVKGDYLSSVAHLSKNVELSRKALRIVALISKKGRLKQSELHKYFRGDIYSYIGELRDLGYVSSEKAGNTRLLRPTSKFLSTFQVAESTEAGKEPEPTPASEPGPQAPEQAEGKG